MDSPLQGPRPWALYPSPILSSCNFSTKHVLTICSLEGGTLNCGTFYIGTSNSGTFISSSLNSGVLNSGTLNSTVHL